MKKSLSFLLLLLISGLLLLSSSCSTYSQIPVETQYNIVDSIQIHQVDSVVYIPKEVIKDVVPQYDTLVMESSAAKSVSYVDTTTHTLKGKLENKKGIEYKYIYKDRVEYRDSTVIKEVPVEVLKEVVKTKHPFYESILWLLSSLFVIPLIIKIVKRIYGF